MARRRRPRPKTTATIERHSAVARLNTRAEETALNLHFDQPHFLLLALLAIPVALVGWRAFSSFDRVRKWTILLVRCGVIAVVAMLLAGPRFLRSHDQLTVIGLLDVSGSVRRFAELPEIPEIGRRSNMEYLRWWFRQATGTRAPDDRFGLVVFDGRAVAVAAPTRSDDAAERDLDISILEGTNIEEAIQLALAMFPGDTSRRMVLVSDGNQTVGDALDAAREAAGRTTADAAGSALEHARGVPIDVVPVSYRVDNDVQIVRVETPPNARPEQAITVRMVIDALRETTGTLTLLREGAALDINGTQEGLSRRVRIPAGRSVQLASVMLGSTAVNRFEAVFEADDPAADQLAENNRAEAFVATPSRGRVLIVRSGHDSAPAHAALARTLDAAGLPVELTTGDQIPADLLELQAYDLIIMQDIGAYEVAEPVQQALARYVHDFGGGLIMLGGEDSFGAGGWNGTPLEAVLPVELDLPKEMRRTHAALVLVLDKSGSMSASVAGTRQSQQEIANRGAAMAIESLQQDSLVGVYTFDTLTSELVPLGPNEDPFTTSRRVRSIAPGGGTNMVPALERAWQALSKVDVRLKHVVCLTDGHSMGTDQLIDIAARMQRDGISVSTIAVGDGADWNTLETMSDVGGGEFFQVINPTHLPRVLVDSVRIINKPLIKEVTFRPVVQPTGATLTAGMNAAPPLEGLVLTAPRDDPKVSMEMLTPEGEPLLAHWQAGLGRAAAFTSDAHLDWSRNWADWPGYDTFFAQLARLIARSPVSHQFELATNVDDGRLDITLDATGEEGEGFLDHLVVEGNAYSPSGAQIPLRLRQVGPGRYRTTVEAAEPGNYIVALMPRLGNEVLAPVIGGINMPAGAEFRRYRSNIELLRQIAEASGGRLLDIREPASAALFDRSGMSPSISLLPMWRTFLYVLVVVFLLDVSARRIAWDGATVARLWRSATARVAPRSRKAQEARATLATLRQRSDAVDESIAAEARGVEKLEADARLRIPRHLRPPAQPAAEAAASKEMRRQSALRAIAGKKPAEPDRKPTADGDEAASSAPEDRSTTASETTGGLLAAKRRLREQMKEQDDHADRE